MKAQASLEMVVGLIILLVVAAVVISLVLYFIKPEVLPHPSEQLEKREFLEKCESYCNNDIIEYCRYYYPGDDWNKDGIKHDLVYVGDYKWPACEDRVYCFLVTSCEDKLGRGLAAIRKCKELLCQTYKEKYEGNTSLASYALGKDINFSGDCNLTGIKPPESNWNEKVFSSGCS